jgi:type I restriction enzyme R subunit
MAMIAAFKTEGLVEIIGDYNATYGQKFDLGTHGSFKKDLAARLAHKAPYIRIAAEPEKRLDLLIVVNQMLTGFDSKWVNTLYLDKLLEYENVIQAFSRTNRLFHPLEKPFGTIRYYRKPHTMTRNIEAAVKLYSGDKPLGLFADRLPMNLERLNALFGEITAIFDAAGITDFAKLPDDPTERAAFVKQFNQFNAVLEAAKIQGFAWEKLAADGIEPNTQIELAITHHQYLTLLQRYKELGGGGGGGGEAIPYDIDSHITERDTGKIDADYMNSRFEKYLKELQSGDEHAREKTLVELQRSFSSLSQDEQRLAEIFLHDIQRGDVQIDPDRTFRDYLNAYKVRAKNREVEAIVKCLGIDEGKLLALC